MEWDPELLAKLRELRELREFNRAKGFTGAKERSKPSTTATNSIITIGQPGDDVTNQNDRQ